MSMYLFGERSDEWLKFRMNYISATEVASLVGMNSYLSANQLLFAKRSKDIDRLDNEHLRDGLIMEPAVFKGLELLGWDVDTLSPRKRSLVFTDEVLKLSSTPDNFRWDVPALIEAKKTRADSFYSNWAGKCPPLRYIVQTQVQMHTTGMPTCFLVCTYMTDDIPLSVYKITYSKEFIDSVSTLLPAFREALGIENGKIRIPTSVREGIAAILKGTYSFEGIFRHGGRVDGE